MSSSRPPQAPVLLAPGPAAGRGWRLPAQGEYLPGVNERLVEPETRTEMLNGRVLHAAPAKEPHAAQHASLAFVLYAHVAPGWRSAVNMLTRSGTDSDFAPDASVYPAAPDPATGRRQLEEIAFEVVSEQSLAVATEKARVLAARGVRRVFCLRVKAQCVQEWSRADDAWRTLGDADAITDRCLVQPLRVRALLDAVEADNAVARALLARGNPVLRGELAAQRVEGHAEGQRAVLLGQFARRLGRELTDAERATFDGRCEALGAERLGEVVLDADRDALAAWLANPAAR